MLKIVLPGKARADKINFANIYISIKLTRHRIWLVGFGFNGPLRRYFSLYRAVSQREGEREERIDESKNVKTTPTRTYCKRNRPLPYCNPNCRTPQHWRLPSTIAPPDHPRHDRGIVYYSLITEAISEYFYFFQPLHLLSSSYNS